MRMDDLVLSYIAGIDRELVVLQGISAQITRVRQPATPGLRRASGLEMLPRALLAQPAAAAALSTQQTGTRKSAPPRTTRPRRDSRNGSSAPPAIPLRMLLPRAQNSPLLPPPQLLLRPAHDTGLTSPPMSPAASAAAAAAASTARFSDAHIEYVGRDCVIHNGAQVVDIAMEHAAHRATPRLVNFSLKT
ncbi:hypothetical protein H4R18_000318 [Coemansia javaensis]|uniref:Uncharacterized protein n=1 Tax=Coemansia javaensis TaxID=2761396 RepID=A0A9W8HIN4_9FUNG|nr:hypothetical protein H4R18_000318 [Coemansia javaensis]